MAQDNNFVIFCKFGPVLSFVKKMNSKNVLLQMKLKTIGLSAVWSSQDPKIGISQFLSSFWFAGLGQQNFLKTFTIYIWAP